MKLSKEEVDVIRSVVNSESVVWAISPRLWKEMKQAKKLGDGYPYIPDEEGTLSVCLDFYPGKLTSRERKNRLKETSEDRH